MFMDLGFHLLVEKKKSCAKVRKPCVRVLWCNPNPRVCCLSFWHLEVISFVVTFVVLETFLGFHGCVET